MLTYRRTLRLRSSRKPRQNPGLAGGQLEDVAKGQFLAVLGGGVTVEGHVGAEQKSTYSMLGHGAADFTTPWSKTLIWNALRWVSHAD